MPKIRNCHLSFVVLYCNYYSLKILDVMKNLIEVSLIKVIAFLSSTNPSLFFAISGYENKAGEVSNQTIQLNIDRTKLADKARNTLLGRLMDSANVLQGNAIIALIKSIDLPNVRRSKAQINAFERLNKNVQYCKETNQFSIFGGQRIAKEIIQKGIYKTVKSRPETIAKNKESKSIPYFNPARFNLDASKYRFFIDGNKVIFQAR